MTMNPDLISHKPRALIVEDEVLIAEDLSERLSGLGFSVVAAVDSAEEGIAVAIRERPDLVLMDIRLKGPIDGVQAVQQIRQQLDAAVVYVSAYSDRVTVKRARESEHDGFILKPFQRRELQSTIEVAMQRHALREARKEG
jgi:CheY-like chemotaxis protein